MLFEILIILAILTIISTTYWRYFYFFRDPDRTPPNGNNIVAPADGTIMYIRKIEDGKVPIAIKNGKEIELKEIMKTNSDDNVKNGYIVGIFMTPWDVHVNRAPISGKVEQMSYFSSKNVSMGRATLNKILGIKPLYTGTRHIPLNERNTVRIKGDFPLYVVQIADSYINKIEDWVKEGDVLEKGQRIGIIKMGSQVDTIFPDLENIEIKVREGEHVKAGETILAIYG
ncbi:MAG: phosphatidylserine decarboxylase [Halobacteriota archaeon]|nr:phosphatidylserine decarboxylase [Halobacteriota archaeon]